MGGHSTVESFDSLTAFETASLLIEGKASSKLDGETQSVGQVTIGRPVLKPLRTKLLWVGVDLDGTLAEPLWTPDNPTSEIGDLIPRNAEKVMELVRNGYKIIIHTSRPWTDYQIIEQWLNHYGIPYKEIQCGKPLYAAYVDDRAVHAEEESWLPK